MAYSRRNTLILGTASLAAGTLLGGAARAQVEDASILQFTQGAKITEGGVQIAIEAFVDDGHSVPIEIRAGGAQTIGLFALLNPTPQLAVYHFGPLAATSKVSTKIRLAASQQVIAIARMPDGGYRRGAQMVQVTTGGCNI